MSADDRERWGTERDARKAAAVAAIIAGPHGWIQWKGTNVCMDVWCPCGEHGHVDAEFCYTIRCAKCGQLFDVMGEVVLVPVPRAEEDEGGRCAAVVTT